MTDKPKNPVEYAEKFLGVHEVLRQAEDAHKRFQTALEAHASKQANLRSLREQEADRQIDLASEERIANPDMSATAFERHLKNATQEDPVLTEIRTHIRSVLYEIDQAEAEVRGTDSEMKMRMARMKELAGLLNFYAAVKMAAVPTRYPPDTHQGEASE